LKVWRSTYMDRSRQLGSHDLSAKYFRSGSSDQC
jgi:hypothetical protein